MSCAVFGILSFLHFLRPYQFPRVSYFGRRYCDVFRRFSNIQATLPINFINKELNDQLNKLVKGLGRRVTIFVQGSRDISDTDLGILDEVQSLVKGKEVVDEEVDDDEGLTIVVLTADLENIEHISETIEKFLTDQFSVTSVKDKLWCFDSLIVKFRVAEKLADDQLSQIRNLVQEKLESLLGKKTSLENIVVEQSESNIQQRISDILEDTIVELGFCSIKVFLQRFIRRDQTVRSSYVKLIEEDEFVEAIRSYFRNPLCATHQDAHNDASFIEALKSNLTKIAKCSVVPLLAEKFGIPDDVCNDLLESANFEENLDKSLTTITIYHLKMLCENTLKESGVRTAEKSYSSDYIVYMVKKDWEKEFERLERICGSMTRVIAVMKKMIFELDGYLKQSKKYKDLALDDGSPKLTVELRKKLLSIDGVYGVGNIYGQLEVHTDTEKEFSTVKRSVDDLLNKINYRQPYSVKLIKEKP